MAIDPNNPVVKWCAEGIALELAGRVKRRRDEPALRYARIVDRARVEDFYPSLYLNLENRTKTSATGKKRRNFIGWLQRAPQSCCKQSWPL